VKNPTGVNGFTAVRRFREAFENAASDQELAAIARALVRGARRGKGHALQLVTERLWPKSDRLEIDAAVTVSQEDREAARERLRRLLERRQSDDRGKA
jgi:hypothetical protein